MYVLTEKVNISSSYKFPCVNIEFGWLIVGILDPNNSCCHIRISTEL